MRPVGIVVDPPGFDDLASLFQAGERVLIQALVSRLVNDSMTRRSEREGFRACFSG
jgi:hypothetical protein